MAQPLPQLTYDASITLQPLTPDVIFLRNIQTVLHYFSELWRSGRSEDHPSHMFLTVNNLHKSVIYTLNTLLLRQEVSTSFQCLHLMSYELYRPVDETSSQHPCCWQLKVIHVQEPVLMYLAVSGCFVPVVCGKQQTIKPHHVYS